ncbi:MAG TPA: hypothetical protein VJ385_19620 [Fibrobacteria bacterium]|nr:hypothetical protein [Fibrobacteria bacterium]
MIRRAVPLFLFAWSLAWILSRRFEGYPPGNDSCYYLVTAKGIAAGRAYQDLSSPDPAAGTLLGPSFFPAALSLYWSFLDPHLGLLKTLVAMLMATAPVFAFLWLRYFLAFPLALMVSLAFGSAYTFIVQGNSVMTECVFCPLLYAGLWLSRRDAARKAEDGGEAGNPAGRRAGREAWMGAILWVILARTRVVGWCFLAIFLASAGRRKRWALAGASTASAAAWVALERLSARGIRVMQYSDGMFTGMYPILVDFKAGVLALAGNLGANLWALIGSTGAHILFPYGYEAFAMGKPKRAVCVAVFLITAWGFLLAWKRRKELRPWLAAVVLSSVPTFLIFHAHDSFRYLMPFFPFQALFFLEPFLAAAAPAAPAWRKRLPALACAVLLANQAWGSLRHDFETEFIDYPRDFTALHRAIASGPAKPDLCLSPDAYYTYLRTGCPAFHLIGRHPLAYVAPIARGKEAWAICGPRNDYYCEYWTGQGVVFGPPLKVSGSWRLMRVERWPEAKP